MRKAAICLFAFSSLLAAAPGAAAEAGPEPGPAWQLSLVGLPTNLAAGTSSSLGVPPLYELIATNVGAGDAVGPAKLRVTLPLGVTPLTPVGLRGDASTPKPVCSVSGQSVLCTAAGPVHPSRNVAVNVPVAVSGSPGEVKSLADTIGSVESPGTTPITTSVPTQIADDPPPFGFLPGAAGLQTLFTQADGSPALQAGGHPDQLTLNLGFPVDQPVEGGIVTGAGHPRDIVAELPRGLMIDPNAAATCTEAQLLVAEGEEEGCPPGSQIGVMTLVTQTSGTGPVSSPLFNMEPTPGSPATFAFDAGGVGIYVHVQGAVRSEGDYRLVGRSSDSLARVQNPIEDVQAQLWGSPTAATHDQIRGVCLEYPNLGPCPAEGIDTPLLSEPSDCRATLDTRARARSWEESQEGVEGLPHETEAHATTVSGIPTEVSGCSQLDFSPSLTLRPDTSTAESPTGVHVDLKVPQTDGAEPASSTVRDVTIRFPDGMALNPAAADGLEGCSSAQIGLLPSEPGDSAPHFSAAPPQCPPGSKIGTMEVRTPLLDHPLSGSVYVMTPYDNPFGTLLGAYVVIESPQDGIEIRLPGRTEADPGTGQLTTSFSEAPEIPFEEFKVDLFGGARAAFRTPATCGEFSTTSTQEPWSGTPAVHTVDSFQIDRGANEGPCVSDEAQMPNHPFFEGGTRTPLGAFYSPFDARLSRGDGEQRPDFLAMTLPPGLTGKLAGVATCSDAAIAAAEGKTGREELASPSCPPGSQIGEVKVGAGAGPAPFFTGGKIYLAGPYNGAPLSGVVITPAVAGPFDLGTVVVRAAAYVKRDTAQLELWSDRAPHILEGIPLELRDVRVSLDRSQFTLNPSSCDEMEISGRISSLAGQDAPIAQRFQVGGCSGLAYEPHLSIRLKGGTGRGAHPKLRAVLTAKPGEANTAAASVALPRSEFLENAHIQTVCTRVQFAAEQCPPGSVYGHVVAKTPLLDETLAGPVYLRSSSHELPDMVADLHGPPSRPIELELDGRIDSVNGGIRTTFETVPDQPVSKFVLTMQGGNKGLIVNSRNICRHAYRATAKFDGQNGKAHDFRPRLRASCGKKRAKHHRQS